MMYQPLHVHYRRQASGFSAAVVSTDQGGLLVRGDHDLYGCPPAGREAVDQAARFVVNGPQALALARDVRRYLRLQEPEPQGHPLYQRLTAFIALFEKPEP